MTQKERQQFRRLLSKAVREVAIEAISEAASEWVLEAMVDTIDTDMVGFNVKMKVEHHDNTDRLDLGNNLTEEEEAEWKRRRNGKAELARTT